MLKLTTGCLFSGCFTGERARLVSEPLNYKEVAMQKPKLMTFAAFFCMLTVVGCDGQDPTALEITDSPDFSRRAVVNHLSVGGADVCEALGLPTGCDANLSIQANVHADGSVSGQWQDTFGGAGGTPATPIHVSVDCVNIIGNQAWVSGVVTGGIFTGTPVITRMADNGTSKNDPPDQIGFIRVDGFGGCQAAPPLGLFNPNGQVTIR